MDETSKVVYVPGIGDDNVLRPNLVVVDGRAYRKFGAPLKSTDEATKTYSPADEGRSRRHDRQRREAEDDDNVEELGEGVEKTSAGYRLSLSIPLVFFKYVIGKGGKTRADIERGTGCKISIPSRGEEGDIVVEGRTVAAITKAKTRIEIVAWSNRTLEPPTHFVCIPLNTAAIMSRVEAFKGAVLSECKASRGIEPEYFQTPSKLHITLALLRLYTREEEQRAIDVLKECLNVASSQLASCRTVRLQGIDSMNDDPSAVRVLHARVTLADGSDRLQRFADALLREFLQKAPDLVKNERRDSVKLHATLIKTNGEQGTEGRTSRRPTTFDVTDVLKRFQDFDFEQAEMSTVKLCQRGKYGPDGFYACLADCPLANKPSAHTHT